MYIMCIYKHTLCTFSQKNNIPDIFFMMFYFDIIISFILFSYILFIYILRT